MSEKVKVLSTPIESYKAIQAFSDVPKTVTESADGATIDRFGYGSVAFLCYVGVSGDTLAPKIPAPTVKCAGTVGGGAGNVENGAHSYRYTFVSAIGETPGGVISDPVTVSDKTTNGKVALTGIHVGPTGTTGRKVYRTEADADPAVDANYKLLTTLSNNSATTFSDNVSDASLTTACPTTDSTEVSLTPFVEEDLVGDETWTTAPVESLYTPAWGTALGTVDTMTKDNTLQVAEYAGSGKKVRLSVDVVGTLSNGTPVSAMVLLQNPHFAPPAK